MYALLQRSTPTSVIKFPHPIRDDSPRGSKFSANSTNHDDAASQLLLLPPKLNTIPFGSPIEGPLYGTCFRGDEIFLIKFTATAEPSPPPPPPPWSHRSVWKKSPTECTRKHNSIILTLFGYNWHLNGPGGSARTVFDKPFSNRSIYGTRNFPLSSPDAEKCHQTRFARRTTMVVVPSPGSDIDWP